MPKRADDSMQRIPQVCVIPYRVVNDAWEFCLITSLKKKRWIFPKGIVDPGETPPESGLKEAWEEAGLRGEIVGPVIGRLSDEKWGAKLELDVLIMRVDEVATEWPEATLRERCWLNGRDAMERLHRQDVQHVFQAARQWLFHGSC
ncbi:MAG: NUDIX hydrolase [Planctomycetales bacterium]|nr:NUDIX hydrolase [Planctomycetales bacterium]